MVPLLEAAGLSWHEAFLSPGEEEALKEGAKGVGLLVYKPALDNTKKQRSGCCGQAARAARVERARAAAVRSHKTILIKDFDKNLR